ncbi:MAG: HD-GYP domain-containing protein [bacterium]
MVTKLNIKNDKENILNGIDRMKSQLKKLTSEKELLETELSAIREELGKFREVVREKQGEEPETKGKRRTDYYEEKLSEALNYIFGKGKNGKETWAFGDVKEIHEKIYRQVKGRWARAFEISYDSPEDYLRNHVPNVARLVTFIAAQLGWNEYMVEVVGVAALLHDVGMAWVPGSILNKKSRLNEDEMKVIREHPKHGANLLKGAGGMFQQYSLVVLQHHERENGSGYPRGMLGAGIHDIARVIGVADAYEAMVAPRVYRRSKTPEQAMKELEELAGKGVFDPLVVEMFGEKAMKYV